MATAVRRKILAVASGGGHWLEMCRIYPAFAGHDVAFVSLHANYAEQVKQHRFYVVPEITRWKRWQAFPLVMQLVLIFIKERPDVVITTGSAPGMVALAIGKFLFRARTMWIDSIANCETLSTSGKLARYFADVWLTQWPQLAATSPADGKKPQYWGAVL